MMLTALSLRGAHSVRTLLHSTPASVRQLLWGNVTSGTARERSVTRKDALPYLKARACTHTPVSNFHASLTFSPHLTGSVHEEHRIKESTSWIEIIYYHYLLLKHNIHKNIHIVVAHYPNTQIKTHFLHIWKAYNILYNSFFTLESNFVSFKHVISRTLAHGLFQVRHLHIYYLTALVQLNHM